MGSCPVMVTSNFAISGLVAIPIASILIFAPVPRAVPTFQNGHQRDWYEIVTHGIGDIASRNPQDKRHSSIRYFNVPYFHWIDGPADGKTVLCHTFQRLDLMAKMPIDKLTPIYGENFPHSHSFQLVSRRTIERSEVMDLVANAAIKKLIMNQGFSSGLSIGPFTSQVC